MLSEKTTRESSFQGELPPEDGDLKTSSRP